MQAEQREQGEERGGWGREPDRWVGPEAWLLPAAASQDMPESRPRGAVAARWLAPRGRGAPRADKTNGRAGLTRRHDAALSEGLPRCPRVLALGRLGTLALCSRQQAAETGRRWKRLEGAVRRDLKSGSGRRWENRGSDRAPGQLHLNSSLPPLDVTRPVCTRDGKSHGRVWVPPPGGARQPSMRIQSSRPMQTLAMTDPWPQSLALDDRRRNPPRQSPPVHANHSIPTVGDLGMIKRRRQLPRARRSAAEPPPPDSMSAPRSDGLRCMAGATPSPLPSCSSTYTQHAPARLPWLSLPPPLRLVTRALKASIDRTVMIMESWSSILGQEPKVVGKQDDGARKLPLHHRPRNPRPR